MPLEVIELGACEHTYYQCQRLVALKKNGVSNLTIFPCTFVSSCSSEVLFSPTYTVIIVDGHFTTNERCFIVNVCIYSPNVFAFFVIITVNGPITPNERCLLIIV